MHILYLAQRYDYGDRSRGLSFEHHNFYESLCAMGHELTYFDYPSEVLEHGRWNANQRLLDIVKRDKPELLFSVIRNGPIQKRTMRYISNETDTTTINWYCDDHWQFDSLAKAWTPCFNYVITTSEQALEQYQKHRLDNVIKSQWAANHTLYKPTAGEKQYDVTFVGQPYGIRKQAIDALRHAGVKVRAWGSGWPDGKLSQGKMIRVFSQSRINLNFADASSSELTRLQKIANSYTVRSLREKPGLWRVWSAAQKLARWDKGRSQHQAPPPPRQIKGRVFEVPACGGFLLTQPAENLHDYLKPGQDCATFNTIDDLVEQVRYYLKNDDERSAIAQSGYQRTLAEHTYAERFTRIFEQAGVSETATNRKAA